MLSRDGGCGRKCWVLSPPSLAPAPPARLSRLRNSALVSGPRSCSRLRPSSIMGMVLERGLMLEADLGLELLTSSRLHRFEVELGGGGCLVESMEEVEGGGGGWGPGGDSPGSHRALPGSLALGAGVVTPWKQLTAYGEGQSRHGMCHGNVESIWLPLGWETVARRAACSYHVAL